MSATTRSIAALWVIATLMLLVFPVLGTPEAFRLYYSNALQTLTSLGSAGVCFYAMAAFPSGSPLRKVWAAIGAGVLAWGIGATVFAAYPLLTGGEETPYPYYSDIGYLATGPLMIIGLLIFKRSTGLESPLWGKLLALVLLAVTVLTATGFRGGEVGEAWWYAVAGILLYFIANQAYTFLVLSETYATGHPIDTGWMLGFGLIAWAALKTRRLVS